MNRDSILIIEAGDTLIINQNYALAAEHETFLRKLASRYRKTYLLSSCNINVEVFNYIFDQIDKGESPLRASPEDAKTAVIRSRSDFCNYLQIQNYQLFIRGDSTWANPIEYLSTI